MTELVTETRTKKSGEFVDERTKKALVSKFLFIFFLFFKQFCDVIFTWQVRCCGVKIMWQLISCGVTITWLNVFLLLLFLISFH